MMKVFVDVINVDGDHYLSRNVKFGGDIVNVDMFNIFFDKLSASVHKKDIGISMLPTENKKRFGVVFKESDFGGEYVLEEYAQKIIPSKDDVIIETCKYFNISVETLFAKTRANVSVKPRQFIMFLFWYMCGMSKKQSSNVFSLDHATGLHAINVSLPAYFASNDYEILGAIEYFSIKYGHDLKGYFLEEHDN